MGRQRIGAVDESHQALWADILRNERDLAKLNIRLAELESAEPEVKQGKPRGLEKLKKEVKKLAKWQKRHDKEIEEEAEGEDPKGEF